MKAIRSIVALCSAALIAQGCATASKDLTASYVSPLQYQSYDCDQLTAEIQRIETRVVQLGGRLDEAANNDKGIMAVGLLIFWPALFALGGTKQQEAEYSRMKGEYDALEQQAVIKKCAPMPRVQSAQSAPLAQTVALPAMPAIVPVAAPAQVTPAIFVPAVITQPAAVQPITLTGESKHMFLAERYAKANGCVSPVAAMTIKRPDSETFTVTCATGDPLVIRCESGACRALQ